MSQAKKKQVLFTINLPDQVLDDLAKEFSKFSFQKIGAGREAVVSLASSAEILVMLGPYKEILDAATKCKWLHVFTAGVEDFLEFDSVKYNDALLLTNVSGIHAVSISEHVFGLILALTRGLKNSTLNQRDKKWVGIREMDRSRIVELSGKVMLLVGLGSIGLMTAQKAKAFGMRTLAVKRDTAKRPKDPEFADYVDEIHSPVELERLIPLADVIVNTLPLTQETEGIFDKNLFSKTKAGAVFVNVGRGKTVKEEDLVAALKSGKLFGAGLDVFEVEPLSEDSPLWELDNVVISPHVSGWSSTYIERGLEIFKKNLRRYEEGRELVNVVDKNAGY